MDFECYSVNDKINKDNDTIPTLLLNIAIAKYRSLKTSQCPQCSHCSRSVVNNQLSPNKTTPASS